MDVFQGLASAGGPLAELLIDSTAIKGELSQAIGGSRGGRTTKHALVDLDCRPVTGLLTGSQVADCLAGRDPAGRHVAG